MKKLFPLTIRKVCLPVFLCSCLLFTLCSDTGRVKTEKIEINGVVLNVEIAETEKERATGLMNRKSLDSDSGMLFVFEGDGKLSFWMKNTYIPLSIAFINSDGIIREIRDMTPESLDPVISKNNVRFALEVNRGYFGEKGISAGDAVRLPERYR